MVALYTAFSPSVSWHGQILGKAVLGEVADRVVVGIRVEVG